MRVRWKRWMTAVTAVAAADAAILLAAGAILAASQQIHSSAWLIVDAMMADVGSLLPPSFAAGLNAILGVLGAGWWQRYLVGPAVSTESGAGVPALAGVLAVPVYTVVRRRVRPSAEAETPRLGSPPHRIYLATGQLYEPDRRVSTAVQEAA